MFGELSDSFILSGDEMEIDLFGEDSKGEEIQDTPPEEKEIKDNEQTTEVEIDSENLFGEPESVGSTEDKSDLREGEDTTSNKDDSNSPTNFYSTTAKAFRDDGIFPDLDDETINGIKTAEDFANAVEKTVQSKFDERQRRIDEALKVNIAPEDVRAYEQTLSTLDSIQEESILLEDDQGEKLRGNLIYQDYINKGYTKERAEREVKKSFNAGTDIEDAKDALESNKNHFKKLYQDTIDHAKNEETAYKEALEKDAKDLKKSMLEDKEIFEGVALTAKLRKEAFENITKPIHQTEDGEYLTAIQKYEKENPVQFRKYLSVLYTMTDGFTNIDPLVKGKVKKEVKQNLRELEHKMTNTRNNSFGNPTLVGGVNEDTETYAGKGWSLDL